MLSQIPIVLISAFAAFAQGAMIPREAGDLIAQETTTMTGYTETNYRGNSKTWTLTTQTECVRLSGSDWNDVISSVKVPSGFRCRLWTSNNCDSTSTPDIYAPGAESLPSNMDNKATSFKCYRN